MIQRPAIQRDPNLVQQALGWLNVRDFGAVGDGVHDDTAAIQACLDQTSAASGEQAAMIYFPEATYLISKPLVVNPFTYLQGNGVKGTSFTTNVPISIFVVPASTNRNAHIIIQDLYVRNNAAVSSTTLAAAASAGASSIAVASGANIVAGYNLVVSAGTNAQEEMTVANTYVPGSTVVPLTAALANAHSSGDYVCSPPNIKLGHPIIGSYLRNVRCENGTIGLWIQEGDVDVETFVTEGMTLWGIELWQGGTEHLRNIYSEAQGVAGMLIHDTVQASSIDILSYHTETCPTGIWIKSASQITATSIFGTAPSNGGGVALVHVDTGCSSYTFNHVTSIFTPRFAATIKDDTLGVAFPDYDGYLFFRLWSDQEGLAGGTSVSAGTLQGHMVPRILAGITAISGAAPAWTSGQGANLRGIAVAVTSGVASFTAPFPTNEPDTTYSVSCSTNWATTIGVTKATTGITFNFGTVAPSGATLDWTIIR